MVDWHSGVLRREQGRILDGVGRPCSDLCRCWTGLCLVVQGCQGLLGESRLSLIGWPCDHTFDPVELSEAWNC